LRKVLDKLIELQEIDGQLLKLEEARGDLPQKVNELASEINDITDKIKQKKQEKKEKESRKMAADGETSLLKEKFKKYQNQLYQVKTNKEYDAMTIEIDNCENKIDELEFEFLELEEELAKLDTEISEAETSLNEHKQLLEENEKHLSEMMEKTKEKEKVLKEQREKMIKGISRPLLTTYDRIRLNRGGRALAYLSNGSCSDCSTRIPPQRGMEIRMMDTIYYCEVCGRILVWQPEDESKA